MMTRKYFFRLLLFASALLFAACKPEVEPVVVDESLIVGKWQAEDNGQEYWRFDADHTGETWDESEDVQEGEGSHYNWTTSGDQLRLDIYGTMGQHVFYDYTVVKQNQFVLSWEDQYGNIRSFVRKLS